MRRRWWPAVLVGGALFLSLKAALNLHCRLLCREDDEYDGKWNAREQSCECSYLRRPSLRVKTEWPPKP